MSENAPPVNPFSHGSPALDPILAGPSIVVPPPARRSGLSNDGVQLPRLLEQLRTNFPIRFVTVKGNLMAVRPGSVHELKGPSALFAMLHLHGDIDWRNGSRIATKEEFYDSVRETAESFDEIQKFPHEPPLPGVLYVCPDLPPATGQALAGLLAFFRPATEADRIGLEAFALTLFWGGCPGSRPAFLLTNQDQATRGATVRDTGRGIGKSTLVAALSSLCGGFVDVGPKEDQELGTRLLSSGAGGKRVVRVDNVKTGKLSSIALERLITTPVISGRKLYVGEGTRTNHLLYAITMNGASVSEDLASRSYVIQLGRPANDPSWSPRLIAYVESHRLEIIADILQRLREPAMVLQRLGRFAEWEAQILGRIRGGQQGIDVQLQRRQAIDGDSAEVDEIVEALRQTAGIADQGIGNDEMIKIVESATGIRHAATSLWRHLSRIEVPGLERGRRNSGVRYFWRDPSPPTVVPTPNWVPQPAPVAAAGHPWMCVPGTH